MSEFTDDLKIDKYALDEEAATHSEKYGEWILKYSQAVLERDRQKQKVDLLRAQLSKRYRKKLATSAVKRVTDAMVEVEVTCDEELQEELDTLHQMNYAVNVLAGAKSAFDQRKKAISDLTQLFISSYFSKPVVPEQSKYKAMKRGQEDSKQKLSDEMRRRLDSVKDDDDNE